MMAPNDCPPNDRLRMTAPPPSLRDRLSRIAATGTPALAQLAAWVLDQSSEVAFSSVRGLAGKAGVNANTVTRLAKELGYDGFDAFRADIRKALAQRAPSYAARAQALRSRTNTDIFTEMLEANRANADLLHAPELLETLESCIDPLLGARRVHSVGVRSCYAIAHYFAYVGSMAFANFRESPAQPGAIMDQLSMAGPEDIVMAISFAHYSTEVVRACQIARDCGARVLALTDSHRSPLAVGAWKVVALPMAGPQLLPSLSTAFSVVEMLLSGMAARSPDAVANVTAFEDRITRYGGYIRLG